LETGKRPLDGVQLALAAHYHLWRVPIDALGRSGTWRLGVLGTPG
jgi:hypothetical protein